MNKVLVDNEKALHGILVITINEEGLLIIFHNSDLADKYVSNLNIPYKRVDTNKILLKLAL